VFVRVWEYEVPADAVPAFRAAYSSHGDWAELFGRYLGTELYGDPDRSGRFLTVDRWRTEQDWLAFQKGFGVDYEALDARLDRLSARETSVFDGSSEL
jgi:hypothetical protein